MKQTLISQDLDFQKLKGRWTFQPQASIQPRTFHPLLNSLGLKNLLMVEKSGVEKFIFEKSGFELWVEKSGIEAWGWKIRGWNVLEPVEIQHQTDILLFWLDQHLPEFLCWPIFHMDMFCLKQNLNQGLLYLAKDYITLISLINVTSRLPILKNSSLHFYWFLWIIHPPLKVY